MVKENNFLEFVPIKKFNWRISEETNKVIVERPKFDNSLLKKYLVPYLKKPHFDVKLDEFGSYVWQQIDGEKTVYEISNNLKNEFGEKVEPIYDRVSQFIKHLQQQRFINYKTR